MTNIDLAQSWAIPEIEPRGRPEITPRQRQVLAMIRALKLTSGLNPTVRELMAAMEWRSTNAVANHLLPLRRRGYVRWSRGKYRTLEVVP